jgi:hypothetical protein
MDSTTTNTFKRSLSIYDAGEDGLAFKRPFAEQEFYYQSAEALPLPVYEQVTYSDEEEEEEELPVFRYTSTVHEKSALTAADGLKSDYRLCFNLAAKEDQTVSQDKQQQQQQIRECFLEEIDSELPLTTIIPSSLPFKSDVQAGTSNTIHNSNIPTQPNLSQALAVEKLFVNPTPVVNSYCSNSIEDRTIEEFFDSSLFSQLKSSGFDNGEDSESSSNTDTDLLYPTAAMLGVPLSGFRDRNCASRSGAPKKPVMNKKNVVRALTHGRTSP